MTECKSEAAAYADALQRVSAENERLRKTLQIIREWDCLNPPAPDTDFPWLKRLVDEALKGTS